MPSPPAPPPGRDSRFGRWLLSQDPRIAGAVALPLLLLLLAWRLLHWLCWSLPRWIALGETRSPRLSIRARRLGAMRRNLRRRNAARLAEKS